MTVPLITTRRLTLRPVEISDVGAITHAMSHWDVVKWLSAVPFPYAPADATYFVTEIATKELVWAIDAGEGLIGVIGLHPDLGYWLDVNFHGQHVMSEAAQAIVDWHFGQSDVALISGHFIGNDASRRVLQKLGFQDTAIVDQLVTATQDTVKLQRMSLSPSDWNRINAQS